MNCALLRHLDTHTSMVPDGSHPRKHTELADMLTEPLPIVYQHSRTIGDVVVSTFTRWAVGRIPGTTGLGRS